MTVFATADHRPWALPAGPWVMAQTWHDLLFAHWPVPLENLRPHVPATLEMDSFDGTAWLGVIPFRMSDVRIRGLPALPGVGAFPELNVRTYVRCGGKPGVWFFSLDAGSRIAAEAARRWYRLPYFHAQMRCQQSGGWFQYHSQRDGQTAEFRGSYRPVGKAFRSRPGTLDYFLTERYCLYAEDSARRLYRGEIHHAPWPLQPAEATTEINTMTLPLGFPTPQAVPTLHFASRQDVRIWPMQRIQGHA